LASTTHKQDKMSAGGVHKYFMLMNVMMAVGAIYLYHFYNSDRILFQILKSGWLAAF
jgi:hypothetical protein